jgi:hypothetical protein
MIQSLDLQIQELGHQIDGFTRQRQKLSQYINDEKLLMEPKVCVIFRFAQPDTENI